MTLEYFGDPHVQIQKHEKHTDRPRLLLRGYKERDS